MRTILRTLNRHPAAVLIGLTLVVLAGAAGDRSLRSDAAAIPVPLPVYEIESVSGSHEATLAGLPLAPVGVLAVPTPVDVDGDLVPDVTVAVSLVDVAGLFNNPPDVGEVLAPNVEIDRLLPGLPLTRVNPPLRINVKLTVLDAEGGEPLTLRLGYDTGAGGSIPSQFKVVADGLDSFFNPVRASVEAPGYEGPLTLVAGFEQGDDRTDADLRFAPFPSGLEVAYGSDDAGQHLSAAHAGAAGTVAADREVDLDADITQVEGAETSTIDARVDRLPRAVGVTIRPGAEGTGGFAYAAAADGRLPDLRVDVVGRSGDKPLVARLDLDGLPPELHAEWSLPEDDGPTHIRFESPRRPVGGFDVRVADFLGEPTELDPFVATAQQFLDVRSAGDDGQRLITGRIEGISLVELTEGERGLDASFETAGSGLPLELHASLAEIGETDRDLEATSTISPLPAAVAVSLEDAGDDQRENPLRIAYDASDSIDVDGRVEVREPEASGAPCGAEGTLCADLDVRDIPSHIETRVSTFQNADGFAESRIEVDDVPREGAGAPDVFADLVFGQADDVPLVAHAEILGIPEFLRVRAVEGADQTTTRAEFHACNRDYEAGECEPDTDGEVGALAFSLRNFLDRPAGLPTLLTETPNYATVVGRGHAGDPDVVDFEAAGRLVGIRELVYLAEDAFGLRTRIGGGEALSAQVDLAGVDLGGEGLSDLVADALVPAVPETLEVCFRGSEVVPGDDPDPVVARCSDRDPFDDGENLAEGPLSVGYFADSSDPTFTLDAFTSVHLLDHGPAPSVADDRRLDASVDIVDLPTEAAAYVLAPEDGPVRAVYDTGDGDAETTIRFDAAVADADLVCRDPRQPAIGDKVFCLDGEIVGLPTRATFLYDAERVEDNLVVETEGDIDITDFGLSLVEGAAGEEETDPPVTEALVVDDAAVLGIPDRLTATLRVPDGEGEGATAVRLEATPPIDTVQATVQNFVGADPLPAGPPAQRAGLPPVDDSYDTVTLLQQGEQFRAAVDVTNLSTAGYESYRTWTDPEDPEDILEAETHLVDVGFGADDQRIRTYVDVDDGVKRAIADVTLEDRPEVLSLCFRGEREAPADDATAPVEPTALSFCDESVAPDGAVELSGTPHASNEALDVNAFFRVTDAADGSTLSGYADVDDLPPRLRTELGGDADAVVAASNPDGTPASVGRLGFHVASFDIPDHGYADPPFLVDPKGDPFPAYAGNGGQHLGAAISDSDFEVRGLVGPPAPGQNGSRLAFLRLAPDACPAPEGTTDYPFYPEAAEGEEPYTCAQLGFESVGGEDRLDIGLAVAKDGKRILVRDAALTDIPTSLQLTLADVPATAGDDPNTPADESVLLPRCGAVSDIHVDGCVPPMLRVDADTPGTDPVLGGVIELGSRDAIAALDAVTPGAGDLPDLAAAPDAWAAEWGANPLGIRIAVDELAGTTGELALRAAFRIPVPDTFTVEQFQSWSDELEGGSASDPQHWAASDVRVAYQATVDGAVVPSLGNFAALVEQEDGAQIIATDGAEVPVEDGDGVIGPRDPLGLPGELDVSFQRRENKVLGRQLIQIDGRVNAPTDLRVRLYGPPPDEDGERPDTVIDAHVIDLPAQTAADQTDPSFRIRADLVGPKDLPGPDPVEEDDSCPDFIAFESCGGSDVHVERIEATLDFVTDPAHPVRLLDAVARFDDQAGFQVQAFSDIRGDLLGEPDALVSGEMGIVINPLDFTWGGGFVLGLDAELRSDLAAYVLLDRVSDFSMRQSLARIATDNRNHVDNPDGTPAEGAGYVFPIFDLDEFDASLWLDLYFFDLDLVGISWIESFGADEEPVTIDFEPCSVGAQLLGTVIDPFAGVALLMAKSLHAIGDGTFENFSRRALPTPVGETQDVIAVPDAVADPRLVVEILDFIPIPIAGGIVAELFDWILCPAAGQPDIALIDRPAGVPGDTLAIPGHVVPDAAISTTSLPPVLGGDDQPLVLEGVTEPMCGNHQYSTVDVHSNLIVGTEAGPLCPADDVGQLHIRADDIDFHQNSFGIVGPDASGGLSLAATDMTVDGTIVANGGPITVSVTDTLIVSSLGEILSTDWTESVPLGPDGEPLADGATGRGGGGHGGAGGSTGISFDGGDAYADTNPVSSVMYAGSPGAGPSPGFGGGAISLVADTLFILGPVNANGGAGAGPGCASTGAASGGGSGGGILIAGRTAFMAPGLVTANGGDGASSLSGSSGGGGAGAIKVLSPRLIGSLPADPVGGQGGAPCPGNDPNPFGNGGDLAVVSDLGPQSSFEPYDGLWQTEDADPGDFGEELLGRYTATDDDAPFDDFTVVVCAKALGVGVAFEDNDGEPGPDGPPVPSDFAMPHPSSVSVENPCGQTVFLPAGCGQANTPPCSVFPGGIQLARQFHLDTGEVLFDPTDPDSPGQVLLGEMVDLHEAFYGVWTMVVASDVDDDDCYVGAIVNCRVRELQPLQPDEVFGIDNSDGRVTAAVVEEGDGVVAGPGDQWFTRNEEIAFTIDATDLGEDPGDLPLSGLDHVECAESDIFGNRVEFECHLGRNVHRFRLPTPDAPADGRRRIEITVVDGAGNRNRVPTDDIETDIIVTRDITPALGSPGLFGPHADLEPAAPDGFNGWYRTAPSIDLLTAIDSRNSDNTQGSGTPANSPGANDPAWAYRFDEGEEQVCVDEADEVQAHTDDGCHIADTPPFGTHTLHFTTLDRLGNRLPASVDEPAVGVPGETVMFETDPIRLDPRPPTSTLLTVPLTPDGANGWFVTRPFVVLSAVDQQAGSGMVTAAGETPVAGTFYRLDGGTEQRFTAPFRLTAGVHQVCWRAIDVAGNADVGVAGAEPAIAEYEAAGHCSTVMATPPTP